MKGPLHLISLAAIPLVGVGAFSPEVGQRRCASSASSSSVPPAATILIPTKTALSYANDPPEPMTLPYNPLIETSEQSVPESASTPATSSKRHMNWQKRYDELVAYRQRFGNADVPLNWPENKSLATWVINQRRKHRTSSLEAYQVELLNAIDFTWDRQKSWQERFAELVEYKRTHGTCIIHSNDGENRELYVWCCNQRQQHRQLMEHGSSALTPERVELLESIGFLDESSVQQSSWNERMEELRDYKKQHGHTNVPRSHTKLGRWVDTQRTSYRLLQMGKSSPLTQERIDMLNAIGFEWNPSENVIKDTTRRKSNLTKTKYTPWNVRYEELQRFKAKYGHVLVDHSTRLGEWVRAQRRQYNLLLRGAKSSLSSTRLALLKELGVFDYQPYLEGIGAPASVVPSAPFIRVGMSDEELVEAWHRRFAAFRD
jgi:hypothetical protein